MTNGASFPTIMAISKSKCHPDFGGDFDLVHSPTDSSEDSVEVKILPISGRKRKCGEPRKVHDLTLTGPLKKRLKVKQAWISGPEVKSEQSEERPFRPWSPQPSSATKASADDVLPLALIKTPPRVPSHPPPTLTSIEQEHSIQEAVDAFPMLGVGKREQRNYKNMTRERRIEANARERTRVHTISAAFETLRKSIPSYSHNQKLSKLSVLRIACSYIMTLSSIVSDGDETPPTTAPTTAECVDLVTKTIQREGKLRKKKDDND